MKLYIVNGPNLIYTANENDVECLVKNKYLFQGTTCERYNKSIFYKSIFYKIKFEKMKPIIIDNRSMTSINIFIPDICADGHSYEKHNKFMIGCYIKRTNKSIKR